MEWRYSDEARSPNHALLPACWKTDQRKSDELFGETRNEGAVCNADQLPTDRCPSVRSRRFWNWTQHRFHDDECPSNAFQDLR